MALALCLILVVGGCGSTDSSTTRDSRPGPPPAVTGGDDSIQTYGYEAAGAERATAIAAMRSFVRALDAAEYAKVCAGLISAVRAQLQMDCKALLPKILNRRSSDARRAASAEITSVRIGGGNAFVLFREPGAGVNFFVMKREGGEWKATGVSAGTPLNLSLPPAPTAGEG